MADRIKVPPPPKFKPQRFMDPSTSDLYDAPLEHSRLPVPGERPPAVRILAAKDQKLLLYRKLADSGRLKVCKHPLHREAFGAGMFAVPKDGARDRMILDARPANQLEAAESRWVYSLASASALSGILLGPLHTLLISGADLSDFFYQFQVGEGRIARNVLADALSVTEASFVFRRDCSPHCGSDRRICIAFSSLAMGDSSACEFAQCSHLGVCLAGDALRPGELLVYGAPVPRGLLSVGLVLGFPKPFWLGFPPTALEGSASAVRVCTQLQRSVALFFI